MKLAAFVVGGAFSGLAGVLYALARSTCPIAETARIAGYMASQSAVPGGSQAVTLPSLAGFPGMALPPGPLSRGPQGNRPTTSGIRGPPPCRRPG